MENTPHLMTAKEFLSQGYKIDQQITLKLEQLEMQRSLATKATSTIGYQGSHGSRQSAFESTVLKIIALDDMINEQVDWLVDIKRQIITVISSISEDEYRILLESRYLCFKSWDCISEITKYDRRYIYKIHRKALAMVEEVLPTEYRVPRARTIHMED